MVSIIVPKAKADRNDFNDEFESSVYVPACITIGKILLEMLTLSAAF